MKDLRAIILAAGKGTRMKSETPKVLHPVCDKPILQYVLDITQSIGSLKTCVVLGHKSSLVKNYLGKNMATVIQKKLLGTADAVRCAQPALRNYRGQVLILCGDTPLLKKETVRALIAKHKRTNADCTFLTAVVEKPSGYGRIIRGDGRKAMAIREEKDASEYEKNIAEINVGVYCFNSDVLFENLKEIKVNEKKKEFYLTDIIEILSGKGLRVETLETDDYREGLGINSREDLAIAESVLRQRILSDFMLQGVTIIDPQTTSIDANVRIGQDTVIRPFTVIENNVRIGKNCSIGPFTHLRPGTRIGNGVEVGNFAEVSRTRLGNNSRMKHFSFLGDAEVGSNVNIGAGVVTANYDGKNKNKTQILDQAFIGSDSILVAPVRIGKKAMTGAGCVVTKGKRVPDGRIIVGVPGKILDKKGRS